MGFLLVCHRVDPRWPVLVLVGRTGVPALPLARPGLRQGERRVLANWEKESGLTWAGLGEKGLVAALVGGGLDRPVGARDLVFRALEAPGPTQAKRRCLDLGPPRDFGPFAMVVAGPGGAWLVRGEDRPGATPLPPGVHLLTPFHRPGDLACEEAEALGGALETVERLALLRDLARCDRERAPGFRLCERTGTLPTQAVTLLGVAPGDPLAGLFEYLPGPPGEREFLDYSNLVRRLHR